MTTTVVMNWDEEFDEITRDSSSLVPLHLMRTISDPFDHEQDDLDRVLHEALLPELDVEDADQTNPGTVSYASSDDTASEVHSIQHSCSSSEYEEPSSLKKRSTRRRATAGLSAQEKSQRRKERNRELAAESRKRKNDEMDRLRKENNDLRQRIAELEKRLAVHEPMHAKRSRTSVVAGASAVLMSVAAFVVCGPAEHSSATASVVLTALDSVDGQMADFVRFIFTAILAAVMVCVFALFSTSRLTGVSPSSMLSQKGAFSSAARSILPDALIPASMTV